MNGSSIQIIEEKIVRNYTFLNFETFLYNV